MSDRPQFKQFLSLFLFHSALCWEHIDDESVHSCLVCVCVGGVGKMMTQASNTRKHMSQLPSRRGGDQESGDTLDGW